jgi:hypothetical protein
MTWEFGSRSGSWFALCLFAALFGVLGWGVSREIRRRSRTTPRLAHSLGFLLFLGPMWLVYASSLGGFYEAEVDGTVLRLRYLLPAVRSEIPLTEVRAIEPVPWYRGRWRLQVVATSERRYESATWQRTTISESAVQLRQALAGRVGS